MEDMFHKLRGREEEGIMVHPGQDKLGPTEDYSTYTCNEYQADAALTVRDMNVWSPPPGIDSDDEDMMENPRSRTRAEDFKDTALDDANIDGEERPDMSGLNPPPGIKPDTRHLQPLQCRHMTLCKRT